MPGNMRSLCRNSVPSRAVIFGFVLLLCASYGQAAGKPIPHGTLELVAEQQWIATGQKLYLGLHFQLEQGWHIYWINPGDSGEPPRIKWNLPAGFSAGAIQWPTPHRLGSPMIVDFGYQNAVTLLVPITVNTSVAPLASAQLSAEVKVLVCREVCIPGSAPVSLALPVKSQPSAPDPHTMEFFAAARKSLPSPAPVNWKISVAGAKDCFVLAANLGHQITQATFFPIAESQIANAAPQKLQPEAMGFQLTLRKSDQLLRPIDRLKGVLVLSAGKAYFIDVPIS